MLPPSDSDSEYDSDAEDDSSKGATYNPNRVPNYPSDSSDESDESDESDDDSQ